MGQPPLLLKSDLTGAVYVVTKYKRLDSGVVEAIEKHDVTAQFNDLAAAPVVLPDPEGTNT